MINNFPILNLYKARNKSSELVSQMIYGEKFQIIKNYGKWLKIKTNYDRYNGFIEKKNYKKISKNTHKVFKLKSKIFSKKNSKFFFTNTFLPFNSKIEILNKKNSYIEFSKNKWINLKDIKNIKHKEKKFSKIYKIFLGTPYLWGGKSYKGIDCSALIQAFFQYNDLFCPRDSKDQITFFKSSRGKNYLRKDYLIFWKGHVASTLNNKSLIHAFGPKKKVLIMNTKKTISDIKKKSNLKITGIRKLNAF